MTHGLIEYVIGCELLEYCEFMHLDDRGYVVDVDFELHFSVKRTT